MSASDDKLLSDRLRAFFSTLSSPVRNALQDTMLRTFDTGNIRNVKLWTEYGVQTRSFIHARLGERERRLREQFATAILDGRSTNRSTKSQSFDLFSPFDRSRFSTWMDEDFIIGTGGKYPALLTISVGSDGSLVLVYDSYPDDDPDQSATHPSDEDYSDVGL